jgi:hypothetical protein
MSPLAERHCLKRNSAGKSGSWESGSGDFGSIGFGIRTIIGIMCLISIITLSNTAWLSGLRIGRIRRITDFASRDFIRISIGVCFKPMDMTNRWNLSNKNSVGKNDSAWAKPTLPGLHIFGGSHVPAVSTASYYGMTPPGSENWIPAFAGMTK